MVNLSKYMAAVACSSLVLLGCNKSVYHSPRYYGYYSGAIDGEVDLIPQYKDHTNLVHLVTGEFNDLTFLRTKLEECRANNLKALVTVEGIFFDGRLNPLSNAPDTWAYVSALFANYQDVIVAFYLVDEPEARAAQIGISDLQIMKEVNDEAIMVKKSFRDIATMYIETSGVIDRNELLAISSIDWIGVDCYVHIQYCGAAGSSNLFNIYNTLQAQLKDHQRLVLIPPALTGLNSLNETELIDINKSYSQYAASNPRVVAIIPFLWQSYSIFNWIGVNDLPNLLFNLKQISYEFRNL